MTDTRILRPTGKDELVIPQLDRTRLSTLRGANAIPEDYDKYVDALIACGLTLPIDAISLPHIPPKVSLVTATRAAGTELTNDTQVTGLISTRGRWEQGISYQPLLGDPSDDTSLGTWANFSTDDRRDKVLGDAPGQVSYKPYIIWTGDGCGSFGFQGHYYAERALLRLALLESYLIANELWNGDLVRQENAAGNTLPNWFFAQHTGDAATPAVDGWATATILAGGTAQDPEAALGHLEDALAHCLRGPVGMIFCTPSVLTQWAANGQIERANLSLSDSNRESYLTTINGTIVISDAGFSGDGPGGYPGGPVGANAAASGSVWAYATSPVYLRRGAPKVFGAQESLSAGGLVMSSYGGFNAETNDMIAIAEKPVAAWWDNQCLFAVKVNAPYTA